MKFNRTFVLYQAPNLMPQLMKLMTTSLLALLLLLNTSCTTEDAIETIETADLSIDINLANETDWPMADEVLQLINEHRNTLGLSGLTADHGYASAYAVDHTKYMIDLERISHDGFADRARALKNNGAISVGENVAAGFDTAQSVVNAWLNSPSHRENIEGNFTHTGFGVMQTDTGRYYFTQLFYKK
ncbi:CAP domain-containing protein [Flavobacteriaceae bacterium]|nr:CAP domain-containing protein [Flavobacteriaceae bacterium]